jgi:carbamate kinase
VVAALGGNALARPGEKLDIGSQRANVAAAARALAPLAREHQLIVAHGNGPQVGLLALQAEAYTEVEPYPLDVLSAQSEGLIGYLIEAALRNQLPGREIATLLTQVEVSLDDPGFARPTKPIGPVYGESQARELARTRRWSIAPDRGGFRRVVPSPAPQRIAQLPTLRRLADAGVIAVCAGGGGIPVVRGADGALSGVEAVVDKDLAAALVASELGAGALLLLTDVEAVFGDWPGTAQPLAGVTPAQLRALRLAPGSMGPKAEAACRFVERTGGVAAIGALRDAPRLLAGETGTQVRRSEPRPPQRRAR